MQAVLCRKTTGGRTTLPDEARHLTVRAALNQAFGAVPVSSGFQLLPV